MEILNYKDIEDLYWFMCDLVEHDSKNVTAVLFYDDALELMRYFIEDYDVEILRLAIMITMVMIRNIMFLLARIIH